MTYCLQSIMNDIQIVIGIVDSASQNGKLFPLFALNSCVIFIRLFVGDNYVGL